MSGIKRTHSGNEKKEKKTFNVANLIAQMPPQSPPGSTDSLGRTRSEAELSKYFKTLTLNTDYSGPQGGLSQVFHEEPNTQSAKGGESKEISRALRFSSDDDEDEGDSASSAFQSEKTITLGGRKTRRKRKKKRKTRRKRRTKKRRRIKKRRTRRRKGRGPKRRKRLEIGLDTRYDGSTRAKEKVLKNLIKEDQERQDRNRAFNKKKKFRIDFEKFIKETKSVTPKRKSSCPTGLPCNLLGGTRRKRKY